MYKQFIDLSNEPLETQNVVKKMDELMGENLFDVQYKKLWNFFCRQQPEQWLADILTTVEYEDKDRLLLFQMAVYRVCMVHMPAFLKSYKENDNNNNSFCLDNHLKSWEKNFWRTMMNGFTIMRGQSLIKKGDTYYQRIEDTINLAFKDIDIIENVKRLLKQYEPFVYKTKRLNEMIGKDQMQVEVESLKSVINILEKNLQGNLTVTDFMKLEISIEEWNKGLKNLAKFFDNAI